MANLDITNDPDKVKWRHFLSSKAYSNVIGIYEGGFYRAKGIYRPEETSVMLSPVATLHLMHLAGRPLYDG